MTTLQMLTVRTNAALGRLATLQRRADRISSPAATVVRTALKELGDALEGLQVANDQLQLQLVEMAEAKTAAAAAERRFEELLRVLPTACVWTTSASGIIEANPAAAAMLNVSSQHLVERPLILFFSDRSAFQLALAELVDGRGASVDFESEVRPRERRARAVRVLGRRLDGEAALCWFLLEVARVDR